MIRRMLASDAESVADLFAQSPQASPWSATDLLQLAAAGSQVWVAEEDARVIGAVASRAIAGEAEILSLSVRTNRRRLGIGHSLMEAALEELCACGAIRVFIEVRESNLGAQEFYRKLRFSQDGRRRNYYRNPTEDALLFSRSLQGNTPKTP
jgi:ribosomal-protein-alanine acetyltransferase